MEFDPEIAVRLAWAGTPVVNTPTRVRYPPGGISHFRLLRDNLRISRTHARLFLGMLLRLPLLITRRVGAVPRAPSGRSWYARPERGSKLGLRITVWAYRTLGHRIAGLLLYPIVAYFFATDPAGRRASRRYLERVSATPEGARTVGDGSSRRRVFRHYLEFGRSVLDRAGFWLGDRSEFAITIRGQSELDRVADEKRGALVLGSHLGSFDAMRLLADTRSPLAVHVLMYTRHAARINAVLDQLRGGMEARVIEVRPKSFEHVIESKARIERGEVVAILADRVPPGEVQRVSEVSFLEAPAVFPQGPMKLAALLGCPVLLMFALRTGDRRYEVHVERFADRVELPRAQRVEALRSSCQAYADRLAAYCVRYPYQWFNFFDFWNEGEPRDRH
jgi:predicted LPLAT superfamily acyltransferase